MSGRIVITLVRSGIAFEGQTASDRWNLRTLLGHSAIPADRNQTIVKRLRRAFGADFVFVVARSATVDPTWTMDEVNALLPTPGAYVPFAHNVAEWTTPGIIAACV
jgi:hypothetical protein